MKEVLSNQLPFVPTKLWGDTALFSILDAFKLLDCCEKYGFSVLGIEGFRVSDGGRVPDMNCIADFSGLLKVSEKEFSKKSISVAREFIKNIPDKNLLLEFVLVEF